MDILSTAYSFQSCKNVSQKTLGDALQPCFSGVTFIPCNRINMWRKQPSFVEISTAEAGSIQLEFRDLSRSSNDTQLEVCDQNAPFGGVFCERDDYVHVI